MGNYYNEDYLAHSKGPWKNHKYIKKVGNRYYYAGSKGYLKAKINDPLSTNVERNAARKALSTRVTNDAIRRRGRKQRIKNIGVRARLEGQKIYRKAKRTASDIIKTGSKYISQLGSKYVKKVNGKYYYAGGKGYLRAKINDPLATNTEKRAARKTLSTRVTNESVRRAGRKQRIKNVGVSTRLKAQKAYRSAKSAYNNKKKYRSTAKANLKNRRYS